MTGRGGSKTKRCPDCLAEGRTTRRKACRCGPHPAGRCHTHHKAVSRSRTAAAHDRYVGETYGLPPGAYEELYRLQGGRCYICRRATGARRRLAVDHDHATGYVRGLLCKTCNSTLLGRIAREQKYGTEVLERAIDYLREPPAFQLGKFKKENEE